MRPVTAVTGPPRSGTSCVTGLLECCGFDLGRALPVLRNPTPCNPRGHFELGLLFTINERLCLEVPGGDHDFLNVPERAAMDRLAASRARYFRLFVESFDGELCKDPLLCLTWPHWERHWPALTRAVFCLRHPLAVARSMDRRYGIGIARGLDLWYTYTARFIASDARCDVCLFDFDAFRLAPAARFDALLRWLDRPLAEDALRARIDAFFGASFVHFTPDDLADEPASAALPDRVERLYADLRARAARS